MYKTLEELAVGFFDNRKFENQKEIDLFRNAIKDFTKSGKKEDALSVYFCYCKIFKVFGDYSSLGKLVEFLSDHEYHSGELLKKQRDHYSHSCYVFALGLALYDNDKTIRDAFKSYYKDFTDYDFLYYWGLVGLFHDIGYPLQLAHEQVQEYMRNVFNVQPKDMKTLMKYPYVSYPNTETVLELSDLWKTTSPYKDQPNLAHLFLTSILDNLKKVPKQPTKDMLLSRPVTGDFMDHGYWSAIILSRKMMDNEVPLNKTLLDSLTAILLHNSLLRFGVVPATKLDLSIKVNEYPLFYLIGLCDELQAWDRTPFGASAKSNPIAFDILLDINNSHIKALYKYDKKECKKVKDENGEFKYSNKNAQELVDPNEELKKIKKTNDLHTNVIFKVKIEDRKPKGKAFASSQNFINYVDFAEATHQAYIDYCKKHDPDKLLPGDFAKDDGTLKTFDELSLEYQLSNIEQAKSYAYKLELINCFYSDKKLDYPIITKFTNKDDENGNKNDLSFLAREEHVRWVKEKIKNGWTYGPKRDSKLKTNPCLLPFDFLTKTDQNKDVILMSNMVENLDKYGHSTKIYQYRRGWKNTLNIFACGHRDIDINNKVVRQQVRDILSEYKKKYRVVVRTCFAAGADCLVAEIALELGITVKGAIPMAFNKYVKHIKADAKKNHFPFDENRYRAITALSVSTKVIKDEKYVYVNANNYCLDKSDAIIALWNGVKVKLKDNNDKPINQGGTYHSLFKAIEEYKYPKENIHIINVEKIIKK